MEGGSKLNMTSVENNLKGRQHKWKIERRKQTQRKTTLKEDDPKGREPQRKTTSMDDYLNGRQNGR